MFGDIDNGQRVASEADVGEDVHSYERQFDTHDWKRPELR